MSRRPVRWRCIRIVAPLRMDYRPAAGNATEVHLGGARGRSEERIGAKTRRQPVGRAGSSGDGRPQRGVEPGERSREPGEHVLARSDDGRGEEREREREPAPRRRARARRGSSGRASRAPRASGSSTRGARTRAPSRPRARASGRRARTRRSRGRSSTRTSLEQALLADGERRKREHRGAPTANASPSAIPATTSSRGPPACCWSARASGLGASWYTIQRDASTTSAPTASQSDAVRA